MRLRELTFPILVLHTASVEGDTFGRSARTWNYVIAEYFTGGGYDDAIIIDATGNRYTINKIYLKKPSIISRITSGLLVDLEGMSAADVDMELKLSGKMSVDDVQREVVNIARAHPEILFDDLSVEWLENMYSSCSSVEEAIRETPTLMSNQSRLPDGKSDKVIDLR